MKQTGFAPILILVGILVITLVGGGAYYFGSQKPPVQPQNPIVISSPTPTTSPTDASGVPNGTAETANWKTYTNNKYQFSFKYPPVWTYADSSNLGLGEASEARKGGYRILLGDPARTVSAGNGKTIIMGSIDLKIHNKENDAFYYDNLSDYYKNPTSTKNTVINGLSISEIHHTACSTNNDCISVLFKKGGNIFIFDTWVWTERLKDLDTIYQILSTFKFTQ